VLLAAIFLAELNPAAIGLLMLFFAFAAAMLGMMRRGRRGRLRTGGNPALDGVWEFLHDPEETGGSGWNTLRGELPDGRDADVTLLRKGAVLELRFGVAVDKEATSQLDAATFRDADSGRAPWPAGFCIEPATERATRDALAHLFTDYKLESVSLEGGKLRATRTLVYEDRIRESPRILQLLGVVARGIDPRRELDVQVGAGHGALRCSYCHEALGPGDDTRTCAGCGTVLHASCHDELGRCPVLGCEGRAPERVRVS
jgi:hypothetical protein